MTDKLKQTLVSTTFASGEQVTAAKLNGALGQLETAIEFINKAIGDINNQQETTNSSQLSALPLSGPNLGRLVGAANWLNPKRLGLIRKTITVEMGYLQRGAVSYETSASAANSFTKYFRLPFPPVLLSKNYTPGDTTDANRKKAGDLTITYSFDGWTTSADNNANWTIAAPDGGTYTDGTAKVATRVNTYSSINTNGDFMVTPDGTVILYQAFDNSPEGFKLTYAFDTIGDAFTGATLNVIPDFAQTTTLCTVGDNGDGTYNITLPTIEVLMGANFSSSDFSSTFGGPDFTLRSKDTDIFHPYDNTSGLTGSPSYGAQCYLPEVLVQDFSVSDVIPEGYIYIWDESTNAILNGGTFTYLSNTSVKVSGLTLVAGSNRYRIVVPGADTSHIVSNLRESYARHNHDGRIDSDGIFRGERIRHADLDCPNDQYDGFVSSEWGPDVSPHPQYLARWGYDTEDGGINQGEGNYMNAMAGDLLFGNTSGVISLATDSYGIYFGSDSGDSAPYLYYDQSEDSLRLNDKGLLIETAGAASPKEYAVYRDNIIRAKARIKTGAAGGVYAGSNFNFSTSTTSMSYPGSASFLRMTFNTELDDEDYSVSVMEDVSSIAIYKFKIARATTYCDIYCYDFTGAPALIDLETATLYLGLIIA